MPNALGSLFRPKSKAPVEMSPEEYSKSRYDELNAMPKMTES